MEGTYISESASLKCRVCQKEMLRKKYKQHLKIKHPKENNEDMTPFGQSKITDLWKNMTGPGHSESISVDTFSDEESAMESFDNERKRRHESGDSGVGEEASCSEAKKAKDVLHDKPDEVSNRELNDKLDKILKCVEKGTTRNRQLTRRL